MKTSGWSSVLVRPLGKAIIHDCARFNAFYVGYTPASMLSSLKSSQDLQPLSTCIFCRFHLFSPSVTRISAFSNYPFIPHSALCDQSASRSMVLPMMQPQPASHPRAHPKASQIHYQRPFGMYICPVHAKGGTARSAQHLTPRSGAAKPGGTSRGGASGLQLSLRHRHLQQCLDRNQPLRPAQTSMLSVPIE